MEGHSTSGKGNGGSSGLKPALQADDKTLYRRRLPHIQPPNSVLFITFRLAGSLPVEVQKALRLELLRAQQAAEAGDKEAMRTARKQYFARWDEALDRSHGEPQWLAEPAIAQVVKDVLHELEAEEYYWLLGFCVMPNHVHVLLQTPETLAHPFYRTLQLLKGRTAHAANQLLQRTGSFWQS